MRKHAKFVESKLAQSEERYELIRKATHESKYVGIQQDLRQVITMAVPAADWSIPELTYKNFDRLHENEEDRSTRSSPR